MPNWIFLAVFFTIGAFATPASAAGRDLADCVQTRDNDLSIAACTRILEADRETRSNRALASGDRCNAYMRKSDYKHALPDCEQAARMDPSHAVEWCNLGTARYLAGDHDGAISAYDTAIGLNPRFELAIALRGEAWAEKGEYDRAIADYGAALRLSPRDWQTYNSRANAWRLKGDYDNAIADLSRAIQFAPQKPTAYALRGDVWRLKGDLERALQDQDRAIALGGKEPTPWLVRGDTYRYKGETDRALADYDRALEISPDFIPAYTGRGLTYEKMGDPARARSEFEKALNSSSQRRTGFNVTSLETARAHLAALDSGVAPPVIAPAPVKAASPTSISTPQAVVPKVAAVPRAKQGRRVALVIGNSGYTNVPALPNPQRDAAAIAATLRAIGFDTVTLETNDGHEKLIQALRNFAEAAENADWAMVYYAGHGIEMGGVNYLIPVDARLATDRDMQFEAIPFDQVMASLEGARKLKLVLLDACRDNPFAPQMRKTATPDVVAAASTAGAAVGTRSIGRGLGEVKVSGATLVVYAAKQGEVALDGDGGNSPFAVAVAQRIATPGVEINKIFRLVRDDVMEATAGRQEPYTYGSLPGSEDFFFVQR